MWTVFSNVGDAAVTLPVAFVCAIWIARTDPRLAWRWVCTLGFAMLPVGLSKILYYAWGVALPLANFRVISGHTMLSTAVWAVALALQLRWWRMPAFPGIAAGLILGALTGASRVHGHSHSVAEVLVGWIIGALAAGLFLRAALRLEGRPFRPVWSTLSLLAVSMLAYGHVAPFQDLIKENSAALRDNTPALVCALSRARAREHG
ncbi:phosphatase PAP2 family protein [Burkholderia sp. Ac-20365]|uniref:phosphatase PAP2 family protein n=1 Tax=Burkholderia sp. Ac-20365 TaxID=2703897 RepID=UPI00197B7EC1|nr:phosphatase PAP2 family protein [Burkholderia sp. Ac-20365]MBN3761945.1 phosphatase PAP2 family protein [Burkholderia sp. Ac-20365]